MQNPSTPGVAVPAFPRMAITLEKVTPEDTVTVLVTVALGNIPLLTVIMTLQVPALVTVSATVVEVLGPGEAIEHPAVPAPEGRLQEKFKGANPVAPPMRVILLVATPLMRVCVALPELPLTVKLMDDGVKVKVGFAGF